IILLPRSLPIHLTLNPTVCIRRLFKGIGSNLSHCRYGKVGREEDGLLSFQFPPPPQCFCSAHAYFFCLIEGFFIDNSRIVIISKILLIPEHPSGAPVVQI